MGVIKNWTVVQYKEGLDSIKDYDAYRIRKITYATEDRKDSEAIIIYQVQGG